MLVRSTDDHGSIFNRSASGLSFSDKLKRIAAFVPATAAGAIITNSLAVVVFYVVDGQKTSNTFDVLTAAVGAVATFSWLVYVFAGPREGR